MKKIVVSVGLVALGASTLQAAEASTLNTMQKTKAWSIQATVRGFYDDNISAAPAPNETESAGFSVIPSVDYGFAGEQTSFNVGYAFTARYFDKQAPGRNDKSDYTHKFDADLSHVFSPTLDLLFSESFVIGQEPDLIRDTASLQPIDGDNMRNTFAVELNLAATQLLGFSFGYNNSFYDYDDDLIGAVGPTITAASNSGLYDRLEHEFRLDSRWRLQPKTTAVVGYTFARTSYTADQPIAGTIGIAPGLPGGIVMSDFRDADRHRFYVGADQVFDPTLSGSVRVGAEYSDFYNDPRGESQWSPYVMASLRYLYQTRTSFDAGVQYRRTAASGAGNSGAIFVRDMGTATVYGAVKHELVDNLFLTGNAALMHSTFYAPGDPLLDDESFLLYQLGLDLSYQFNPNLSAHVGYNYDQLESDPLLRDYKRNRVYLGVTAGF